MTPITGLILGAVAPGVWSCATFSPADADLAQAASALHRLDLAGVSSKDALMGATASQLKLPDYFGHNFDALEECLLDCVEPGLLIIENSQALIDADSKAANTLVQVLDYVSTEWLNNEAKRFDVVFVGAAPDGVPEIPYGQQFA